MVIYKDTPVRIKHKVWHIHKLTNQRKGKNAGHRDFCNDLGDIPAGQINEITNKFEPCINNRGYGYAARNRLKYRKCRKENNDDKGMY